MLDREQGVCRQVYGRLRRHGEEGFAGAVALKLDEAAEILATLKGRFFHDIEAVFVATIGFPAFEMRQNAVGTAIFRDELDHVVLDRPPAGTFAFHRKDGPPVHADDVRILNFSPICIS